MIFFLFNFRESQRFGDLNSIQDSFLEVIRRCSRADERNTRREKVIDGIFILLKKWCHREKGLKWKNETDIFSFFFVFQLRMK